MQEAKDLLTTAHPFELLGLARPDGLSLLVRVLEQSGVDPAAQQLSRERLSPLLNLLADHPLSIELVGPHLKRLTPEEVCLDFGKMLAEFKVGAGQERNESLLASLAFSTRRLSGAAQAALPWLGLFSGGVFEQLLLYVSGIEPAQWEAVRAELEATALVRVERDILLADRPYLRFHPTLAYAAAVLGVPTAAGGVADIQGRAGAPIALPPEGGTPSEIRQRFIAVYGTVMQAVNKALRGSQPRWGMEVLVREEANYRTAVRWAVADQAYDVASDLGHTFRVYLERSGLLRERDAWVAWLADEVRKGGFSEEAAAYERNEAWSLFTQGQPQVTLQKLQALIERLRHTTQFDPAFQLATTQTMLGRVLDACGLSEQAIPVLEEAVQQWETLVEKEAGRGVLTALLGGPLTPSSSASGREGASMAGEGEIGRTDLAADQLKEVALKAGTEIGNLSATLGDLANAMGNAGLLDEALDAAEKGLAIDEQLGRDREVAASYVQCAKILREQGRTAEADARYDAALTAARLAEDKELEGTLLQHQGSLAREQGQPDRASNFYQRALKLFQEMNNDGSIMRTCNLLGIVEQGLGRLPEARTWYERSREIAQRLGDTMSLGAAVQNLGIVCQKEGEAARQRGDEKGAETLFREALRFITESLEVDEANQQQPGLAQSHCQLAKVHLLLGELVEAERHAQHAREIMERLGMKELHVVYSNLADISRARGDVTQADGWERKRDAVLAELERRARGEGSVPPQFAKAIQALSVACAHAGFGQSQPTELDPGAESALAQLKQLPAPLPHLAAFLRRVAAGEQPPVPAALPPELRGFLEELLQAIREAGR